ncbi:MAG: DUF4260 family protein [Bradyrhizobiaceae bacterium]|nr:MAG: DUF4260 family protein [Bradyrhizobiaceae bacterium]
MDRTVLWQRVEGGVLFVAGLVFFWHENAVVPWWEAFLVFFAPDLSFLGYLLGPAIGAFCYNAVHVYAFGAVLFVIGLVMHIPVLALLGALWLAHSGFDRMLGYGLKSPEGFSFTHLGRIGMRR